MNNYFTKLNIQWPDEVFDVNFVEQNLTPMKDLYTVGDNTTDQLLYTALSSPVSTKVWSMLNFLQEQPLVSIGVIKGELAAHTDTTQEGIRVLAAINVYLQPNGHETVYFETSKPEATFGPVAQGVIREYDPYYLQVAGSFKANQGDTYLINTQKIHGVYNRSVSLQPRKYLSIKFFQTPYDTLRNILQQKYT